jgi:hypothetical protein
MKTKLAQGQKAKLEVTVAYQGVDMTTLLLGGQQIRLPNHLVNKILITE